MLARCLFFVIFPKLLLHEKDIAKVWVAAAACYTHQWGSVHNNSDTNGTDAGFWLGYDVRIGCYANKYYMRAEGFIYYVF